MRAEGADGFLIGNHTWDHPDMTTLSAAGQAAELDKVIHEQELLAGSAPCVFRPPYGDYDSTTLAIARARRMSVWMWSVDTEDWEAEGSGSSYWVNRIISLAESEGGALNHPVVLMHNQGIPMPATVTALPRHSGRMDPRSALPRTGYPDFPAGLHLRRLARAHRTSRIVWDGFAEPRSAASRYSSPSGTEPQPRELSRHPRRAVPPHHATERRQSRDVRRKRARSLVKPTGV